MSTGATGRVIIGKHNHFSGADSLFIVRDQECQCGYHRCVESSGGRKCVAFGLQPL
jgi:hypothetical protein